MVVAPLTSLITANLNKSILDKFVGSNPDEKFDTVLVDDANLVDEIELIQAALRFGCRRLLLFGNSRLNQKDFSLANSSETSADHVALINSRTLFARTLQSKHANKVLLPPRGFEPGEVEAPKKKSRKSPAKKPQAEEMKTSPDILFVNVKGAKVIDKKESFTNEVEADAVLDYYVAHLQQS